MKINVQPSGLKIGVNNAVTDALLNNKWGIELEFTNEEQDSRYRVVLSMDMAEKLLDQMISSINAIDEVQMKLDTLKKPSGYGELGILMDSKLDLTHELMDDKLDVAQNKLIDWANEKAAQINYLKYKYDPKDGTRQ